MAEGGSAHAAPTLCIHKRASEVAETRVAGEKLSMNRLVCVLSVLVLVIVACPTTARANPATTVVLTVPGGRISEVQPTAGVADSRQATGIAPTGSALLPESAGDRLDPVATEEDFTSHFTAEVHQILVASTTTLDSQRAASIAVTRLRLHPTRGP